MFVKIHITAKLHEKLMLGCVLLAGLLLLAGKGSDFCGQPGAGAYQQISSQVSSSLLNAFAGEKAEDDAVVRWNFRGNSGVLLRLDSRNSFRTLPPHSTGDRIALSADIFEREYVREKYFSSNEVKLVYYRRLWQKVLPMRAGPGRGVVG